MSTRSDEHAVLASIFDSIPSGVFLKDAMGRFTFVNKQLANMLLARPEDLLGKTDADFYPSQAEVEKFRNDDLHVMKTGVVVETLERFTTPKGEQRILTTVKRRFLDPKTGEPLLLGIVTDITAIRSGYEKSRAELEEKERQLKQAEERLSQLSAQSPNLEGSPYVFVSYKHSNELHIAWVRNLVRDLVEVHGIRCMLDQFDVAFGDSLQAFMQRITTEATHVVMIITEESVEAIERRTGSVAFEAEIAAALRDDGKLRLIPVLRSGTKVPAYVRAHLYVDFRHDDYYREMLRRLADSISGRHDRPLLNRRKNE